MHNVRSRPCDRYAYKHGRNDVHGMRRRKIHVIFANSLRHLCSRLRDGYTNKYGRNDVYGL